MFHITKTVLFCTALLTTTGANAGEQDNWSGFYLGGGISSNKAFDLPDGGVSVTANGETKTGLSNLVGASGTNGHILAGYNWQFANTIIGIEADYTLGPDLVFGGADSGFDYLTCPDTEACGYFTTYSTLKPLGHLRGTLGFETSANSMVYLSAGVSFANAKLDEMGYGIKPIGGGGAAGTSGFITSPEETLIGTTIGAGTQVKISRNLIFRGEITYDNFGTLSLLSPKSGGLIIPGVSSSYAANSGIIYTNTSIKMSLIYSF